MFLQFSDIPFIVLMAIGIFLPEVYIRRHFSYGKLVAIRLITLFGVCTIAAYVNVLIYPHSDPGTWFTRAFVFIGFSRLIFATSKRKEE